MASRKKEAAGKAPAAAQTSIKSEVAAPAIVVAHAAETIVDVSPQTADEASGTSLIVEVKGEGEPPPLEQLSGVVGETPLLIQVGQAGGQVADALVAPVVELGPQKVTITLEKRETVEAVTTPRKRVALTLQDYLDERDKIGSSEVEVRTKSAPSRWRIGRQFSRTATPLDLEELSDLEIVALLGDEMLLITAQI